MVKLPAAVLTLVVFWLVSVAAQAQLSAASPQPAADSMKPGLAVNYYYGLNQYIFNLENRIKNDKAESGTPLPWLNYKTGSGAVLTAPLKDAVGAHIRGYVRFDEVGTYLFAIESNDGVKFSLAGQMLIKDPDVHPDRWSDVATAEIATAGWYDIEVLYFEKRNTSTLRLVWKKPSSGENTDFVPVPKDFFAHTDGLF